MDHKVILVRGLSSNATEKDVIKFFNTCKIGQLHLVKNIDGLPSGGAFIEMETLRDVKEGLKFDGSSMGSRYVEVFEARYFSRVLILVHVITT